MTKDEWINQITKASEQAGTYKECFDEVIKTLASILEKRDKAEETFQATGGNILVKHTNKSGATNIEQNPVIRLINDLNRDALAYWRDLGLTPAGLKKLNDNALKVEKKSSFAEVLANIGI